MYETDNFLKTRTYLKSRPNASDVFLKTTFEISSKGEAGYVAITSSIIITALILVLSLAVGSSAFLGRGAISRGEFKEISRALAESCADVALLRLAEDSAYAGGETVAVGGDECEILPVVASGTDATVVPVRGSFKNSFTDIEVTVSSDSMDLLSWEEVEEF